QVRHLLTKVRGHFSTFDGTIQFDEQDPRHSSVRFSIDTASIDTNVADRDTHLRSADFFHVEQFPAITFATTNVTPRSAKEFDVEGTWTIRGVSKPVTLPVSYLGTAKDPWGNVRAGFEAGLTLNRKDFGLLWNATLETGGFLVGDEVTI